MKHDRGLEKAIKAAGGTRALAAKLGIKHQAISQWRRIPLARLLDVEKASGVRREELRPELYR